MKTLMFISLFLLIFPVGIFANDFDDALGFGGIGSIYSHEKSVKQNYNQIARSLRRSCNIWGDASACTNLGTMYALGLGVDQDFSEAAELYQEACDLGDSNACLVLGTIYDLYYTVEGLGLNYAQLALLFQNDCSKGDGIACFGLGLAYALGLGVDQDFFEAAEYFQRACYLGYEEGCTAQELILLILGIE